MILNSVRIRNILFAGICVLLATAAVAKIKWNPSSKLLTVVRALNDSMYASVGIDLLDDNRFVTLWRVWNASDLISNMSIQLVGHNHTIRECVIPYVNVTRQIRRLSRKTALITVNDYDTENEQERIKLLLVNTNNCKYSYVYDVSLPVSYMIYPISNSTFDERFTLNVYDQELCKGYHWCRLYFYPLFRKLEPLDFDLDFPRSQLVGIGHATTNDVNLFVVRFTDDLGTHRVRLYDVSNNRTGPLYKELFAVHGYHTKSNTLGRSFYDHLDMTWYKLVSSGLSFCWRTIREDKLPNVVHCSRFQEDGTLMFNKTIEYPDVMGLDRVTTIPNGLILFSRKSGCGTFMGGGSCSIVYVAVITRDFESVSCDNCSDAQSSSGLVGNELLQVMYRHYNITCLGGRIVSWKVQANVTDRSFEVQYVCQTAAWINHGVFSIY